MLGGAKLICVGVYTVEGVREYAVEGVREYRYAVGQVYGVRGMLVARQSERECAARILGVRAQAWHSLSCLGHLSSILFDDR